MKFAPLGQRGAWDATWQGKRYPVVHLRFADFKKLEYRSPSYNLHKAQHDKLIADIHETGAAIIAKSIYDPVGDVFKRTGYHSLWKVANPRQEGEDFVFDFVERLI